MLEEVHEILAAVGKTPGKYLVSCFLLNGQWRVDFYSAKEHKMYTYFRENGVLRVQKDEIFQKEQGAIVELKLEKVKVPYMQALDKVSVDADKFITILQVIGGKVVWNITILTAEFKVYNLKVDAETGETISEEEENIMNFKKGEPNFKTEHVSG